MKHLLTCLLSALLLVGPAASAQTSDPVRRALDSLVVHLDRSQVPSGRLFEAAVPLAYLPAFDGVLHDSARTDLDGFRLLYATALSARVYGTEPLPFPTDFNQAVRQAAPVAAGDPIPVAVQYITYNTLRPDAETAGLLTLQNGQLRDVAGRTSSPYLSRVLFAAAAARTYSTSRTVALTLPSSLYLASGALSTRPKLYLDFGDGNGYRLAAWNQALSTTYPTDGVKRIRVKFTYSSSPFTNASTSGTSTQAIPGNRLETRESWFDLTVLASLTAASAASARYPAAPNSTTDGFDWVIPFTGAGPGPTDFTHHRGATVNVRYGQGHTSVVKPFIVVEGYDTSLIAPNLIGVNN